MCCVFTWCCYGPLTRCRLPKRSCDWSCQYPGHMRAQADMGLDLQQLGMLQSALLLGYLVAQACLVLTLPPAQ